MTCKLVLFFAALAFGTPAFASETVVDTKLHHLRAGDVREWTEFAEQAEGDRIDIAFDVNAGHPPKTLRLRHRDVKQSWKLTLNGREIGRLPQDENDTVSFWSMPDGLPAGPNTLTIISVGGAPDDILLGDMRLDDRPLDTVLNEATLEVAVTENGKRIPCRLTLVDANGSLVTLGTRSGERLAVRPGVVYTADGWARLSLPVGRYTIYAGRGFEYGIDSAEVELTPGGAASAKLSINREVPTEGWVACDTHWFGLLNRGLAIMPVGSSDSHDVARHFIGQGRTYIRCDDAEPGAIDVDAVVDNMLAGRLVVSMGLMTEITLAGQYGPGDLVEMADDIEISVRVLGPSWTKASHVVLYANGLPIREAAIDARTKGSQVTGVQWQARWTLPRPKHDIYLVAVATGPGVTAPYWPIPKAYQPTSPDWQPYVIGLTGAVRLDADGVQGFTCAHDYAVRLVRAAEGDATELCRRLTDYDEAVAVQASSVWAAGGGSLFGDDLADALRAAPAHVGRGFAAYTAAWRESQAARAQ